MELFFQDTLAFLLLYKYTAIFLVTFLAAFALPLPSSTTLMTAAGFASQGYLDVWLVIFFGVLGNVLADNMSHLIARNADHLFLTRFGLKKITGSNLYRSLEEHLRKHLLLIIFLSRFEVIATITVNVLTGLIKIRYRPFFLIGLAGEVAQVSLFVGLGYFFGGNWENIITSLGEGAFLFIPSAFLLLFLLRKRLTAFFASEAV